MIDDARTLESGRQLDCDLCIIGAGPAGLTIARSFEGLGLRVVVLESGGFEASDATTDLYRGRNVGREYLDLTRARRRQFGGSTNCWTGLCLPFRSIDFESRDWIAHSGWPFDRGELDRFYPRAHQILAIAPPEHDARSAPGPRPIELAGPLESDFFRMSPPVRLGRSWRRPLEAARDVQVLLQANVTRLVASENGRRIERIDARCLEGPEFSVTARRIVLACGGLENPRLLLHSEVGNRHDLVGRFFMEHPHTDFEGLVVAGPALARLGFYGVHRSGSHVRWGLFRAPDAVLRAERMLNFSIVLLPFKGGRRGVQSRDHPLADAIERAAFESDGTPAADTHWYTLGTPSEQAPNPDSRVRLGRERDALGMPRIELDWRLSPIDKHSVRRAHELMAVTLARAGLGRMKVTMSEAADEWPPQLKGGAHHMGTTRMHEDPQQGVCDAHGYVHGVENLMVAGSSLFPTSGAANPTLTIVALALRAAERLRADLGK